MLKFYATEVVVSKGFNDKPALRFSEDGSSVRFRIGKRVYDKRAEDNHRWININIKAFGELCERIKKMNLAEGSFIHVEGRYDEDVWEDNGTTNRVPVIILTDIEYSYSGNGNGKTGGKPSANESSSDSSATSAPQQDNAAATSQQEMPENFTGFESFGGPNPFFPQG